MATGQQDTEITLGTGRMLALFFVLVLVCASFFAIGFSLGRKSSVVGPGNVLAAQNQTPSTVVRPTAGKNNQQPTASSPDFSFYKAVGQKTADGQPPTKTAATPLVTATPETAANQLPDASTTTPPVTNGYFVQVAAVTRQEDADALVEALKKKQYPAFIASNAAGDKFYRVQVGPFTDIKDAELMRGRLTGDGYNPILKK